MHFLIFQIDFVRAWTCIDHIIAGFTARIRSERKGNVFSCAAQSVCSQGREEGSHVTSTHDDIGQSQVTSGPPPPGPVRTCSFEDPHRPRYIYLQAGGGPPTERPTCSTNCVQYLW